MATRLGLSAPAVKQRANPRVRIHRANSIIEIDALGAAWRDRDAAVPCPQLQFAWTRACLTAFAADAAPHVVAGFVADELVAVAPLVQQSIHGINRITLAGARELPGPIALAHGDARSIERLLRRLAHQATPLVLERLAADSWACSLVRRVYRGRAIISSRAAGDSAYLALDPRSLTPESRLGRARRAALRTARARAEQFGQVSVEIHSPELDSLPALLDTVFDIATSGRDERPAPLADPQTAVFYRRYAADACAAGILRVALLRLGDRVVAAQLAIEQAGAYWLLVACSDPRFSRCAPALLLAGETIGYATEAGLGCFEFAAAPASVAAFWRPERRRHVTVRVYPFSSRGGAALAVDLAAAVWRCVVGSRRLRRVSQRARRAVGRLAAASQRSRC